jgi:hypothetical protein
MLVSLDLNSGPEWSLLPIITMVSSVHATPCPVTLKKPPLLSTFIIKSLSYVIPFLTK